MSVEFAVSDEFEEFDDPPHADNALRVSATVITANFVEALEKLNIGFLTGLIARSLKGSTVMASFCRCICLMWREKIV